MQVHPRLFTQALAELSGARVIIGEVVSLSFSPSSSSKRPTAVSYLPGPHDPVHSRSSPLSLPASTVVIAAGPWVGTLAPKLLGPTLGGRLEVTGARAHSIVLRTKPNVVVSPHAIFTSLTLAGGAECRPELYPRTGPSLSPSSPLLSLTRSWIDETIYMCGSTDESPLPPHPALVRPSPQEISDLKAQAYALSPHFLEAEVVAEQACYLPVTDDRPLVGPVRGVEGVWVGAGLTCWGITQGQRFNVPGLFVLTADAMGAGMRQGLGRASAWLRGS